MTLLKKGISYGSLIVSRMIFVCHSCDHIDIVSEKNYSPSTEKKCPKCQSIMVLSSTNTDVCDTSISKSDISGNQSKE